MKIDVFTTERMRVACLRMSQNIQSLDYISAHRMETDKVYQDVLRALEEDLCAIELSVGEMRSDLITEDWAAKYRILLAEKEKENLKRLYLAEQLLRVQTELKGLFNEIETIPKKFLEDE
jgi:hypothetical protein